MHNILWLQVYSVVNGVVHLELFKQVPGAGQETSISLNEYLIGKGYAEFAEESYLSKVNVLFYWCKELV